MKEKRYIWVNPDIFPRSRILPMYGEETRYNTQIQNWIDFQNPIFRHQPIIDRTNQLELPFEIDVSLFEHPEYYVIDKKISDICVARAREIVEIAHKYQHRVVVFYSGGVDSTAVLCSFIELLGLNTARDLITVFLSEHSIRENQKFYDDFIKDQFKTEDSHDYHEKICEPEYINSIFVNGDPAGSLFGGGETLRNKLTTSDPSRIVTNPNWKDLTKSQYSNSDLYEYATENMLQSSGHINYKISDVYDYYWWYTMNYRWVGASINLFLTCRNIILALPLGRDYWKDHNIAFFNSDDFARWSFSNKEHLVNCLIQNNNRHYKKALKEFIFSCNQDQDYLINKGKEAYLNSLRLLDKDPIQVQNCRLRYLTSNYETC